MTSIRTKIQIYFETFRSLAPGFVGQALRTLKRTGFFNADINNNTTIVVTF